MSHRGMFRRKVSSGPSEPFFTFKTKFDGEVSFSITKTGVNATWYMGDGTIYTNTNSVTHIYADSSEKTVNVAVGDALANVTNVNGIVTVAGGVSAVYFAELLQIPAFFKGFNNQFEEMLLPPQVNVLSIQNNVYPSEVTCIVNAENEITNTIIRDNTANPSFDLSNLNMSGVFSSSSGSSGKLVVFPNTSNAFSLLNISGFRGFGNADLSPLQGPITTINILQNRNMTGLILPNLEGTQTLVFRENFELNDTVVLDNNTGLCTNLEIYRNDIGSNKQAVFDLTNFNFAVRLRIYGFSNQGPAKRILLPASNPHDFNYFQLGIMWDQGAIDLSGFTGAFSGTFIIGPFIRGATTLDLPPNLSGVESISITKTQFNDTITIDNGGGNCINLLLQNCGNPFGSNTIFDLANFTGSVQFRILGFTSTRSCKQVVFPTANNGDYSTFSTEYIAEQGDLDLSGFTGVFTGDFFIRSIYSTVNITLPANLSGLTNFTITECTHWSDSLDLGTQVIASNINLNSNGLTTVDIDSMISKIDVNVASFPLGAKSVNFGNGVFTNNQTPSPASIATMTSLAASDNFTFTYWDGSSNVIIS